jgi:hypothetical protein
LKQTFSFAHATLNLSYAQCGTNNFLSSTTYCVVVIVVAPERWTGIGLNERLKLSTKQILSIEQADNELKTSRKPAQTGGWGWWTGRTLNYKLRSPTLRQS